MEVNNGGLRFALFIERADGTNKALTPTDEQIEALEDLDYVEEVSSTHFQDYKVVFHLEDILDFSEGLLEECRDAIMEIMKQ